MAAGALRRRCIFASQGETPDGYGGFTLGWNALDPVWGHLRPERGTERLEGGRLEANLGAVLRVRSSATTRAITESYKVTISGVDYQIRSIANPDQRNKYIEMTLERGGVAQ